MDNICCPRAGSPLDYKQNTQKAKIYLGRGGQIALQTGYSLARTTPLSSLIGGKRANCGSVTSSLYAVIVEDHPTIPLCTSIYNFQRPSYLTLYLTPYSLQPGPPYPTRPNRPCLPASLRLYLQLTLPELPPST